jgi:hypothetical protein
MSFLSNLSNAWETTKAAAANVASNLTFGLIKSQPIQANVSNPTLKKGLEFLANQPATVAGIATVIANPTASLSVAKSVASSTVKFAQTTFNSLNPLTKIGVIASTPIAVGAFSSSSTLRKGAVSLPSSLVQFGTNIGSFADKPSMSSATDIFKANPVLTSAVGLATVGVAGYGASSLVSNYLNTKAVKENTASMLTANTPIVATALDSTNKYDVKVAEINAKASEVLAKQETKQTEMIADVQSKAIPPQTITETVKPVAKKKAKKKAVKKKVKKKSKKVSKKSNPVSKKKKKVTKKKKTLNTKKKKKK